MYLFRDGVSINVGAKTSLTYSPEVAEVCRFDYRQASP